MYFLLDYCCKVSKADSLPHPPCNAAVAPVQHSAADSSHAPLPATPAGSSEYSNVSTPSTHSPNSLSGSQLPAQVPLLPAPAPHSLQAGPQQQHSATIQSSNNKSMQDAFTTHVPGEPASPSAAVAVVERDELHHTANMAPAVASSHAAEPLGRVQEAFSKKPCRACTTAQDMLAAFRTSQFAHHSNSSQSGATAAAANMQSSSSGEPSLQPSDSSSASKSESAASVASASSSQLQHAHTAATGPHQPPQPPQQQQLQPPAKQPFWFYEDDMPCPPDILELGRATWTLLHSVAAYYPDQPTDQQQQKMRAFVDALGEFYPCEECRGHLQKELLKHPPEVGSAADLSRWACRLHNLVNVRLGKPAFDCSKVMERWRDGPADDPDACGMGGH